MITLTRWPVRWFLWIGYAALSAFVLCAGFVMRNPSEPSLHLSQVVTARVDPSANPDATISMFEAKEDRLIVVWTEGLTSLSADYAAK